MSEQRSGIGVPSSPVAIVADVPLAEFGDTMKIEGVIVGDGTKQVRMYLPGEERECALWWEGELTLDEALAWLRQSDDPTMPLYRHDEEITRIVKAIVRKSSRQVDQNVAWACYARDGYECKYCGAVGVPLTYDHLLAQAFGGKTTVENGVSACRPCNKAKGHKTLDEWIEFMRVKGLKYAEFWANQAKSGQSLSA